MTAPSLGSRSRRTALAAAGLGLAAVALAPTALAGGYQDVTPPPSSSSVPPVSPQPSTHTTVTVKAVSETAHGSLAYTGAEVGTAGLTGLALVVGGALLVRGGRRRSSTLA